MQLTPLYMNLCNVCCRSRKWSWSTSGATSRWASCSPKTGRCCCGSRRESATGSRTLRCEADSLTDVPHKGPGPCHLASPPFTLHLEDSRAAVNTQDSWLQAATQCHRMAVAGILKILLNSMLMVSKVQYGIENSHHYGPEVLGLHV